MSEFLVRRRPKKVTPLLGADGLYVGRYLYRAIHVHRNSDDAMSSEESLSLVTTKQGYWFPFSTSVLRRSTADIHYIVYAHIYFRK